MSHPRSIPLKLKGTNGDLQRLSSTEENYLAYLAGLHMSEDSDVGSLTLSSTGNTLIGTFVDTFFNEAVGTHPASLITTSTTSTNLYQILGAGAGYTDSDHRAPVVYLETGGVNTFTELEHGAGGEDLDELIDRLNSRISTSDYPGVFKLGSSSPGADYTLYISGVYEDTQTDGTTVSYNIYRRTSMSAPSSVGIMAIKRSNGGSGDFEGLQEMTERQMKVSLGQYAKNRSAGAGNVGSYQLRSSTQGAPTDEGTWRAMGTATDTKKQTANQDFTRDIDVNYTAQYLEDFTADYAKDYVKTYTGDYTKHYTFDYIGDYTREFLRNAEETYSLTFTGDYVRDFFGDYTFRYTGNYLQDYTADYAKDYNKVYTGNYTNTYTGDFAVDFIGDYVRDFSREVDETTEIDYNSVGSQQNIEENYTSRDFNLVVDTSRSTTFTGDYTNFVNSTRTDVSYVTTSREGGTFTKVINSAGEADFLGNYVFEQRDYAGGGGTTIDGPKITFSPNSYLAVGSSTENLFWEGTPLNGPGSNVTSTSLGVIPRDGVYRNYIVGGVTYTVAAFSSPSFSIVPGTTYYAVARRVAAADVNYTADTSTFVGDYVGPKAYSREPDYVQTFVGDYTGNYTGDYTRKINFTRNRASTFVSSVSFDYSGDFLGNYTRDFIRTYVGTFVGTYTNPDASQQNIEETYTREYTRPRDSNYTREPEFDYTQEYLFDYTQDYQSFKEIDYLSFSNLNITEDYARDFIGDYTGDYAVNDEETYTGDYANEYSRERDSNYTNEYLTDYARDYLFDYTTTYTGNFTGLTIQSSSTTIQTYTLYVRSA